MSVESTDCTEKMREYKQKWRDANREKCREYSRKFRASNPEKAREAVRASGAKHPETKRDYRVANADKVRDYMRNYHAAHRDKSRESARKYRAANPEKDRERHRKYNAANKDKSRERLRKYRATHPDVVRAQKHRRRSLINTSIVDAPTARQIEEIMREPCIYCGEPSEHLDHVIPLSRGGTHEIDNLVPACAKCNVSKWAKLPVLEWNGRFSKLAKQQPTTVQEK